MRLKSICFTIVLYCLYPNSVFTQHSFHIDLSTYITYQEGKIFGIAYEYQHANNEWIFGLNYLNLGNRKRGPDFAIDGGRSAKGLGLKLEYNRAPEQEENGLFCGFRTDLQFTRNTFTNFLSWPNNTSKSNSTIVQPTAQFGYQFSIKNIIDLKAFISGGWNFNYTNSFTDHGSVFITGIRFDKVFE